MKNLQRMLSLALAMVMLLGMMTMGVSAAPRFLDEEEIVHTEAVRRASERGLFVGANGNFMPKGTVNRAQMATIVVKMMYGSEYNVEPHKKVGKFPDTAAFENGWAEGYINLCSKDGIVVGYEDGYFRPGNQVTAAEAVTMILNALKVDTGKEPWPLNVMNKASEMELFAALGEVKSDTVLNRDQLAVIVMASLDWKDAQKEQPAAPSGGGSSGSSRPSSGGSSSGSSRPSSGGSSSGSGSSSGGSSSGGNSSNPGGEYGENELPRVPVLDENNALIQPFDVTYPDLFATGDIKYSGEQIMIKLEAAPTGEQQAALKKAGVEQLELMMDLPTAKWYKAAVKGDVTKVMEAVRELDFILVAEYDYAYEAQGTIVECKPDELDKDVHGNGKYHDQWHLRAGGVHKVWDKFRRPGNGHTNNGNGHPGNNGNGNGNNSGDSSTEEEVTVPSAGDGIVVAVIDTGVDYTHEDLKNSMWVNTAEIPDDGRDNDGNGYIDDYYGYNAVANKGSAMDDQGHGTHVAGIIAAANNNIGVVGVAYNAKIMPIKAGMASGYFNQSDIAEAIMYAYQNGADVINMSFGGSASSIAVQDALELAYTHSVLVAAAGNDGLPNQPTDYYPVPRPTYPAALTYVLGVMSVDESGTETSYSNWDVVGFNAPEYEVYAPGDQILSTIPGNRYATWSGTSMAAPFVSAVAALIRDEFRDNNTYPTKFIYGQICGTGTKTANCFWPEKHTVNGFPHNLPQIVDVYAAMTEMPRPDVGVTDFTLFDTVGLMGNTKNNGDGVIDAGETFALGFTVRNKWGMSKDTTLWVDAKVGQAGMVDPYITIHTENVNIGQVGTYSTGDCGKVMEDGAFVGWEKPIYITVSPDCPNDYIFTLNVHLSCENALDEEDKTVYTSGAGYNFDVRRGVILPTVIDEDLTLTADNFYIIPQATLITAGTTVTVEPGTQIQFWGDDPDDAYAVAPIVVLNVEGNFICEGTPENRVRLFPSQRMDRYRVEIAEKSNGRVELLYTDIVNPYFDDEYPISYAEGCEFTQSYPDAEIYYRSVSGGSVSNKYTHGMICVARAVDCSFYQLGGSYKYRLKGRFEGCLFVDCAIMESSSGSTWAPKLIDCVMLGNNTYRGDGKGGVTSLGIYDDSKLEHIYTQSAKNPETGITYVQIHGGNSVAVQRFADYVGGYLASFNTVEEWNWVDRTSWGSSGANRVATGARYNEHTGSLTWADGTQITPEVQAALGMTVPSGRGLAWFGVPTYYNVSDYPPVWMSSASSWLIEIPAAVEEISLNAYEVALDMESTGWQIGATVAPASAAGAKLIYESMDSAVAAVSDTGLVTPVGIGSTTIRVYSPDKYVYNTLDVAVKEPVALESIALGEPLRLNIEDSATLAPVLTPADTTKRALVYTTSDNKVATVDANGTVTAVGKGFATITATNPETGISGTVTVEGYVPTTAVTAEESIIMLDRTAPETVEVLGVSVLPANSTDTALVWESSNPEVVAVDENGNLVKGELGTATLRATHPVTGLYFDLVVALSDLDPAVTVVQMEYEEGYYFALLSDGTLWYWGNSVPTPRKMAFENVKQFAVERYTSTGSGDIYNFLILDRSGTANYFYYVREWNFQEPETPDNAYLGGAPMTGVKQVDSDNDGSWYLLREDGTAYAWGDNGSGQLGDGSKTSRSSIVQVNGQNIDKLAAGNGYVLLLHKDGSVTGFGHGNTLPTTLAESGAVDISATTANAVDKFVYYTDRVERYHGSDFTSSLTNYLPGDRRYADLHAWLYVEDGKAFAQGSSGYIFGTGDAPVSSDTFTPVVKVDKVTDAFLFYKKNTFFQTADGKFYGAGNNGSNWLGNLTQVASNNTPTRIYFGLAEENGAPALESDGLTDGALTTAAIMLDYDMAVYMGSQYAAIKLTDSAGQMVSIHKTLRLDKLILEPMTALTPGQTYTITVPASALKSAMGVNSAALTLTFTAGEVEPEQPQQPEATEPGQTQPEQTETKEPVVYTTQVNPDAPARPVWTDVNTIHTIWDEQNLDSLNDYFRGNAILNRLELEGPTMWFRPQGGSVSAYTKYSLGENYWGTTNELLIQKQMIDFSAGYQQYADLIPDPVLTTVPEHLWPVAVNAGVLKDGEVVTTIGNETVTFFVEFNRDMDTTIPLDVRFGSAFPYADYQLEGAWVNARRWEGTTTLTTLIESGYQYFSVDNGRAADEIHKTLYKDWGRFWFEIDTSDALAMTLQGNATDEGIALTWYQDDFDTLAGYNVYRADKDEDAFYQKLNTTVIPFGTEEFFDDTVEPGKVYYYTFTVVKTDLSESSPSGKIRIVSKDTMAPVLYHTPVYQTYAGRNVVISATATDNVALEQVQLHCRVADGEWVSVDMQNMNSSYSAIISGNNVTEQGLSYYVTASDGISTVSRGSAENPYVIVVQPDPGQQIMGDVDGDGRITLLDALMVLRAANNKILLNAEQFARADLDGDGLHTAAEALKILKYANGEIGSLQM